MAMVMIDAAGQIALVTAETEKLFGYTREELLGKPMEMLVPQRFREAHPRRRADFFADPMAGRMGPGRELHGLRRDGREFPIETALHPHVTPEGDFALASIIDVTERRRAEVVQLNMAAIVKSSEDAIISKDLNGVILTWNRSAERIFGYAAEEIIGSHMARLLPAEILSQDEEILGKIRRGERVDRF